MRLARELRAKGDFVRASVAVRRARDEVRRARWWDRYPALVRAMERLSDELGGHHRLLHPWRFRMLWVVAILIIIAIPILLEVEHKGSLPPLIGCKGGYAVKEVDAKAGRVVLNDGAEWDVGHTWTVSNWLPHMPILVCNRDQLINTETHEAVAAELVEDEPGD
jgi:hypothetical protein